MDELTVGGELRAAAAVAAVAARDSYGRLLALLSAPSGAYRPIPTGGC